MPDGIISEENNQVTYQLPGNIKLSSEIKDGVVKSGELTVGTYTIDENGLVTITYRTDMSNFNPSKKFPGTLIFNCSANANKNRKKILSVLMEVEQRLRLFRQGCIRY